MGIGIYLFINNLIIFFYNFIKNYNYVQNLWIILRIGGIREALVLVIFLRLQHEPIKVFLDIAEVIFLLKLTENKTQIQEPGNETGINY